MLQRDYDTVRYELQKYWSFFRLAFVLSSIRFKFLQRVRFVSSNPTETIRRGSRRCLRTIVHEIGNIDSNQPDNIGCVTSLETRIIEGRPRDKRNVRTNFFPGPIAGRIDSNVEYVTWTTIRNINRSVRLSLSLSLSEKGTRVPVRKRSGVRRWKEEKGFGREHASTALLE